MQLVGAELLAVKWTVLFVAAVAMPIVVIGLYKSIIEEQKRRRRRYRRW